MVQPSFVGAETQSATAQRAVKGPSARAANQASKLQSKSPVDGARFGAVNSKSQSQLQ
jgi:hypothetical protein